MSAASGAVAQRRSGLLSPTSSLTLLALLIPLVGCPKTSTTVSASESTLSVDRPTGVVANGTDAATITVVVIGTNGKPLSGQDVVLTVTGSGNTFSQPPATDANGQTTTTLASTVPETKTISAAVGKVTLSATATVTFIAPPAPATQLAFTAQPTTTVAGSAISAIQVTIEDMTGAPVTTSTAAVTIAFGTNPEAAALTGTTTQNAVGGVATFPDLEVSQVGTGYTLVASSDGLTSATSAPFNITAGTLSVTNTKVTASPGTAPADGSTLVTVTATAEDANMNPIAGVAVSLSSMGGSSDVFAAATGTTDASGVFTTTVTSTLAESDVITASIGGHSFTTTVEFTAGVLSQTNSSISASPSSVPADGTSTSTVTVTAKDAFGNPLSGATVALAPTGTGNTFSHQSGTIGADGTFTSTVSSTVAQTETISATVGGTAIAAPATLSFSSTVVPPATVEVAPGTTPETTGTQGSTTTLTVLVLSASAQPLPGITVAWAESAGSGSISPGSVTTGSDGTATATATLGSTVGEVDTFTATVGTLTPVSFSITVEAGPASLITIAGGNGQSALFGTELNEELTVVVTDANDNLLTGVQVDWTAPPGGAVSADNISWASTVSTITDTTGVTSVWATLGSTLGTESFTAAIDSDLTSVATFSETATGAPSATVTVSGDGNETLSLTGPQSVLLGGTLS
jgi:hypothetical protein